MDPALFESLFSSGFAMVCRVFFVALYRLNIALEFVGLGGCAGILNALI